MDADSQELFTSTWRKLAARLNLDEHKSEIVLEKLLTAYGAEDRGYHGIRHIASLIELFQKYENQMKDPEAFLLAIFFHDYVYEGTREKLPKSNEARSADAAETELKELGISPEKIARVRDFIMATEKHKDAGDAEINLFLDCDLSILASPAAIYEAYAKGVKREYMRVYTEQEYNAGRATFLAAMAERPKIFLTETFSPLDEKAKENMRNELEKIRELGR